MGCHGFGITRALAAAVEQFHDEAGLRLPRAIAPFDAVVVVANRDDERVVAEAERVHRELGALGVASVLDDREATAGVKFADADLVGYPVQAVVGRRGVEAGTIDLKVRATGERSTGSLADGARAVLDLLATAP
jgi:prolyl-tRNA synthetase